VDAEDLLAQLPTPHDPSLVLVAEQVAAARNRLDQVPAGEQAAARKELAEWIDRWSRGVKDAGTGADARLRAGVRAAIAAALREAGPDATMRDGLPVLARLLGKYGV
jgi:hypothetical protein